LFKNVQIQIKYIILHLHMCFIDYVKGGSIQETLVNVILMLYFMVVNMATSYHTCSVFLLVVLRLGLVVLGSSFLGSSCGRVY
jgi:hypothetical protein